MSKLEEQIGNHEVWKLDDEQIAMDFEVMGIRPPRAPPVDELLPKKRTGRPKLIRALESESAYAPRNEGYRSSPPDMAPSTSAFVPGPWMDNGAGPAPHHMARSSSSSMGHPIGSVTEIYRVPDSSASPPVLTPTTSKGSRLYYTAPALTGSGATGRHWPGPVPAPATGPRRSSPSVPPGMTPAAASTPSEIPSVLATSDGRQPVLHNQGPSYHFVGPPRVDGDMVSFQGPPPPPPLYAGRSPPPPQYAVHHPASLPPPSKQFGDSRHSAPGGFVTRGDSFGGYLYSSGPPQPTQRPYDEVASLVRSNTHRSTDPAPHRRRDGQPSYIPNPPTVPSQAVPPSLPSSSSTPVLPPPQAAHSGNSGVDYRFQQSLPLQQHHHEPVAPPSRHHLPPQPSPEAFQSQSLTMLATSS
jgi:hypothetical protein